ncbi:MAG: glycosyltransferase family protein [Acidobacteriia bacterium]|nr:glycosyltransferase family protein [Terriglobia bacterium]
MKTVAIIQARMSSTRLPGKVMAAIGGIPLLERVVRRAKQARTLDIVAVATTDRPSDNLVANCCRDIGIPYFRGNEDDVLDRYYRAAESFEADVIVRLTADCPLLDATVIDKVVRFFHAGDNDYVSNTLEPSYPDGLDTEVFSRRALERAWREARLNSEREHVTPYIWKQPDVFRVANVKHIQDLSSLRWTVDEPEDLEFVRRIYAYLETKEPFGMDEVLALLQEHPELSEVNVRFERNEGYQKSLREEAIYAKKEAK